MNKKEFTEVILPVTELYSRVFSAAALQLYFEDVQSLDAETFSALLKKHRATEQGKFWPTFSHLVDLAGTENDAGAKAGIEFDKNTGIDGTGSFDRNQETQIKTATRRKNWVERKKLEWKNTGALEKLSNPLTLPDMSIKKSIGYQPKPFPKVSES